MKILLNGDSYELPGQLSLTQLLEHLNLLEKRLAIELNQAIIPRSQHSTTTLQADDVVEIVHAIGGG